MVGENFGYRVYAIPRAGGTEVVTPTTVDILTNEAPLGVYAYDIKCDHTTGEIEFWLAGPANGRVELAAVNEALEPSDDVYVISEGSFLAGRNTVNTDISSFPKGNYIVRVVIYANPTSRFEHIFSADYPTTANNVAVNNLDDTRQYGTVYVGTPFKKAEKGIYMFRPNHETINTDPFGNDFYYFNSAREEGSVYQVSPYRMSFLPSGRVMVADWSDPNSGLYVIDPENQSETPDNMMKGTRDSNGRITNGGTVMGGSTTVAKVFTDAQGGKHVYAFVEDYPTANSKHLISYALNADETLGAIEKDFTNISKLMNNGNVDMALTPELIILGQKRFHNRNVAETPSLVIATHDDRVVFTSGDMPGMLASSSGAVALRNDVLLAVASDDCSEMISFFRLHVTHPEASSRQRAAEALPTVTLEPLLDYTIYLPTGSGLVGQMDFDPAGNLHVAASGKGYSIYAIPCPDGAEIVTRAPEIVESDGENSPTRIDSVDTDVAIVSVTTNGLDITVHGTDGDITIFGTDGRTVYSGTALGTITMPGQGVYLLQHSHGTLKFSL